MEPDSTVPAFSLDSLDGFPHISTWEDLLQPIDSALLMDELIASIKGANPLEEEVQPEVPAPGLSLDDGNPLELDWAAGHSDAPEDHSLVLDPVLDPATAAEVYNRLVQAAGSLKHLLPLDPTPADAGVGDGVSEWTTDDFAGEADPTPQNDDSAEPCDLPTDPSNDYPSPDSSAEPHSPVDAPSPAYSETKHEDDDDIAPDAYPSPRSSLRELSVEPEAFEAGVNLNDISPDPMDCDAADDASVTSSNLQLTSDVDLYSTAPPDPALTSESCTRYLPPDDLATVCATTFITEIKTGGYGSGKRRREWQCTFPGCIRRFTRRFNCATHVATHLDVRRFACTAVCPAGTECGARFGRLHDLKRHHVALHGTPDAEGHTGGPTPPWCKCSQCHNARGGIALPRRRTAPGQAKGPRKMGKKAAKKGRINRTVGL